MTDPRHPAADPPTGLAEAEPVSLTQAGEPPVVARLVVEIRSDGSQTIARGAMEDTTLGVKVGIEARGATPMELAAALARSMLKVPLLRSVQDGAGRPRLRDRVRALLPGGKKR